ncbi:MAG TPA: hypothetical protein VK589_04380 [Chryseolinea sp.]|nr:hypothetical protein [Chryseolinea sp.]
MAAELLTRLFTNEIVPNLFPSTGFMTRAKRDDDKVNNNSVELQNAGAVPTVEVNRNVLPAPINQRTDVPHNYEMEELTSDPTLLRNLETLIEMGGMNKRADILKDHILAIREKMAKRALVKWATGVTVKIPTTGATRAVESKNGVQTGNRASVAIADLVSVQQIFHKTDVLPENEDLMGVAVIPYSMKSDLLKIAQFTDSEKAGPGRNGLPSGVLARAMGFDWYVRSEAITLNTSDVLVAEGAAEAASDQNAAVFYSPNYVRLAQGATRVDVSEYRPELYGHIMSGLAMFGAVAARNDKKGIAILFENNI